MPKTRELIQFYLISFTWGLPWTLVGLLVFGIVWLFLHEQIKVRVVAGRISVKFTEKRFGGVSLGIVYFVDRSDSYRLNTHELGHTIQSMYWGPLFVFVIAIPSFLRYHYRGILRKYFPDKAKKLPHYDAIWFEGQATKLGIKHFDEAVRKLRLNRGLK